MGIYREAADIMNSSKPSDAPFKTATSIYRVSADKIERQRQLRRARDKAGRMSLEQLVILYKGICQICHQKVTNPTRDHIVPLAKGGRSSRNNLQLACFQCNQDKADKDNPNPRLTLDQARAILKINPTPEGNTNGE